MPETMNEQLRGHIAAGQIRRTGLAWEAGIFEPFELVTNPDWERELDRMYAAGEISLGLHSSTAVLND